MSKTYKVKFDKNNHRIVVCNRINIPLITLPKTGNIGHYVGDLDAFIGRLRRNSSVYMVSACDRDAEEFVTQLFDDSLCGFVMTDGIRSILWEKLRGWLLANYRADMV